MRVLTTLLSLVSTLVAVTAVATATELAPTEIVNRALQQVEWNPGRHWAYTQTGFDDETLIISRFDPSKPDGERWTLLSVDNRPPTVEDIEAFDDEKQFDQALPDEDSGVPEMIEFESLELINEDRDSWTFGFQPLLDGDEIAFTDKMTGEIGISKESGALQFIDIRNRKTIRPMLGVKIKTMIMHFEFAPAAENGPQVMSEIKAIVKGGAYLLVSFNENESTRFSDFEFKGDSVGDVPVATPK